MKNADRMNAKETMHNVAGHQPMRIAIVSCVFPPEPVVSATTSDLLLNAITSGGDQAVVITSFPCRPSGKLHDGFKKKLFQRSEVNKNKTIIRCFSIFSTESTIISRVLENITFGITSSLALLFIKRPDAVYINTWPIFAQGFTTLVCKLRKLPIILSIQDMYPESLDSQNRVTGESLLFKSLRWFDKRNANAASALIVISKQFQERYIQTRMVNPEKITVVPNFVDDLFSAESEIKTPRDAYSLHDDDFVFFYGGNIGVAAGVETVIQAHQASSSDAKLIVAGAGSQLENCQNLAQPERTIIHSPWKREETRDMLQLADVFVLPTSGTQSLASVPSKLMNYMFAGRPILVSALPESEIAEIIQENDCGWLVPPDDIESMQIKMQEIVGLSSSVLSEMGTRARAYALHHYDSEACTSQILRIIHDAR